MTTEYIRIRHKSDLILIQRDPKVVGDASVCWNPEEGLDYEPLGEVAASEAALVREVCEAAYEDVYQTVEEQEKAHATGGSVVWGNVTWDTISRDEPPTLRTTVAPAAGGNYQEVVTEGLEVFGQSEPRPWLDLPADELEAWAQYIEGTHDACVRALETLSSEEHHLWTVLVESEVAACEWEDQVSTMEDLIDALDGLDLDDIDIDPDGDLRLRVPLSSEGAEALRLAVQDLRREGAS